MEWKLALSAEPHRWTKVTARSGPPGCNGTLGIEPVLDRLQDECTHRCQDDTICNIMTAMPKTDKTLTRMRNNPRDWRIESLETVAARFGITVRKPAGSHVVFQHDASVISVTVPAHRPIKPVYVKQFLALIDDVRS
ncbi:MAG: type II toxin-antitoxin system HicA family toxin [Gammaproteobacteria bacterium]